MGKRWLEAEDLTAMFLAGAAQLSRHAAQVDALNVFPVPDGDTGTNMNLTMNSGINELKKKWPSHCGQAAQALSKGLLMGARGNSGVILSQLFRGFAKYAAELPTLTAKQLAGAFHQGVQMAYKAVMKPVEGTILTVAKEAAAGAVKASRNTDDVLEVMQIALEKAKQALARTPEQLPVLKEVGVVDSGGQGLVYIYEGFIKSLFGERSVESADARQESVLSSPVIEQNSFVHEHAQLHMDVENIDFGYCTEFFIMLEESGKRAFRQEAFRQDMSRFGDSLLVVADDDLVKVHIHADHPGDVLTYAQHYGELTGIKIENMRKQYLDIVEQESRQQKAAHKLNQMAGALTKKPFSLISVSAGEGISKIFKNLGVDVIVTGGQTMNPSTEDLVKAASGIDAEHIIFLPNNKNIIMAAEQAVELLDVPAAVVPSRSIPQGISAVLAFNPEQSFEANVDAMSNALSKVKTGQVTYAVRDTRMDHLDIKEGDFLGLAEGKIVVSSPDALNTSIQLVHKLVTDDDEILTILYGAEVDSDQIEQLAAAIKEAYPDLEVEIHEGGQPLYHYIFSVE